MSVTGDEFQWLEEIDSPRSMEWVKARNQRTLDELEKSPTYAPLKKDFLKILQATDRVPYVAVRGEWVYNFWQDAVHVRGIARRMKLKDYQAKKENWETFLDIDSLGKKEGKSWVYEGVDWLAPEFNRGLVSLSDGGKDAASMREFDLSTRSFLPNGFSLPEGKHRFAWLDQDTLLVGVDEGGESLTDSGYPRTVRIWRRGQTLADAPLIFSGEKTDVSVQAEVAEGPGYQKVLLVRRPSFFEGQYTAWDPLTQESTPLQLDAQADILDWFHVGGGGWLVRLARPWSVLGKSWAAGSLLQVQHDGLGKVVAIEELYRPDRRSSLQTAWVQSGRLFIQILNEVKGQILELKKTDTGYVAEPLPFPKNGMPSVMAANAFSNWMTLTYEDFLTPRSMYLVRSDQPIARLSVTRSEMARFKADGLVIRQGSARSKDGASIPYFVVQSKKHIAKGEATPQPTLLYGYGGFRVSKTPFYSGITGKGWLEKGGVYVVANIRGGGEFGPDWHEAALKKNRQIAFDDFIAVAEALVADKVTTPAQLGIMGGSNGGLLMGAMLTQRPDLFGAVVCQVPLLDMMRYHRLLAGASWMAEYGNPDIPEERAYILKYSPYQRLQAGKVYPKVLFTTSTRDDRVHPGHARKMAARMEQLGYPFFYYENIEGGHGGAADSEQRARLSALEFSYLWSQLSR